MRVHDLVVVGGGLAGTATAYFAARRGADVVLLERSDLNLGASGSNAGSIHAQIPFEPFRQMGEAWAERYAATIPLFRASIQRWHELEAELDGSLGVAAHGGLMVAGDEADLALLERKADIERRAGLDVEIWDADGLRARAPFLAPGLVGAAFCGIEGKADPFRAVPLLAPRSGAAAGVREPPARRVVGRAKRGRGRWRPAPGLSGRARSSTPPGRTRRGWRRWSACASGSRGTPSRSR